jgi:outer membrane receptor protein involved in Fe transport
VGSDTDVPPYSSNLFYFINPSLFNGQPVGDISGSTVPNPNLRPMRVSEWEVGLQMDVFNNLSFEINYYDKLSKDQILSQQISNTSGFTSRRINIGESENRGVEMLLDFYPIRRAGFSWNATFNASYNTTEVLDLGEEIGLDQLTVGNAQFHGELRQVTGEPMNQLYGWGWLRDAQGRQVFNPNTGIPLRSEEQLSFGSAIPNWVGGISNRFNYKNATASFLIDFKLGHNLISGTHINAYRHGLDKATLVGREQGYVIGDGVNPDGSENTARADVQSFYEAIRAFRASEQSVFKAGSWQLRELTIGYDFTSLLPDNIGVRGLRLSAVARNVAVLKKWVPHVHPDQNGIISDQRMGLEATGLPVTRSIGLNLNLEI